MSERKFKRRHLIYYLRVYDCNAGVLIGHLADITTDGIMLVSEAPLKTDADFNFKMTLPAELRGSRDITFNASSVWCQKDVNPDFYATGFKISNIENKDLELIESLIDSFGFRD
ncbi:MAG: PilZ domain-containing protein [Candidatus Omnitrophica bacterium]|nr:PilZ domain-containing protein [Candidatus Omnitrophota bacterium]